MRILMTRNLGSDWPERWCEGDVVEATEDIGRRLLALGFAVRLAESPPQPPEPEPDAGEESTSGGGSPPTTPAAPRPPSPAKRRGRKRGGA